MIRPILRWPDPGLAVVCEPVADAKHPDVAQLLRDLVDTMEEASGRGLAAPQIGVPLRACVIRDGRSIAMGLVNPRIVKRSGVTRLLREGCLSLPGFFETVRRDSWVEVEDELWGRPRLEGPWAHAAQHELEHLDGQMFLQHLSFVQRNRAKQMFPRGKTP